MFPTKVVVSVLAVGASAASVGGYVYATSGKSETIFDKVNSSLETHHKILSSKRDAIGDKGKLVYKGTTKDKKVSNVSEDKIGEGCETTLKESFDQDKYDKAVMWCVVHDRSLKDVLNKSVLTVDKTNDKGKNAWDKFSKDNASSGELKLDDNALINPNPSGRNTGGPALGEGCISKYEMKMYELNAEDLAKKVEKGCNEEAGNS